MCLLCECDELDLQFNDRRNDKMARDALEEARQAYAFLSPGNPAADSPAPAPSADRDKQYKPAAPEGTQTMPTS